MRRWQSGQMQRTVNPSGFPSLVRIQPGARVQKSAHTLCGRFLFVRREQANNFACVWIRSRAVYELFIPRIIHTSGRPGTLLKFSQSENFSLRFRGRIQPDAQTNIRAALPLFLFAGRESCFSSGFEATEHVTSDLEERGTASGRPRT